MSKIKNILKMAYENNYAIPAYNFENFDVLEGIIQGAASVDAPIIVQTTEQALSYLGFERVVYMAENYKQQYSIPVILHLDHANNIELVRKCINSGYSSVMVDYSEKSIEDNINCIKDIVEYAKSKDVLVEAEVGLVGNKDTESVMTEVQQVSKFVNAVTVDSLAVSIGNEHGGKTRNKKIDFELLNELFKCSNVPLVLHGSSGLINDDIIKSIQFGVSKINIETELRVLFKSAIQDFYIKNDDNIKPRDLMTYVKGVIADNVMHKCVDYRCAGKG